VKKIIEKLGLGEYVIIVLSGIILLISHLCGFSFSESIGQNFWMFFSEMITFLPLMFILIGLADVWIPKEKVEMHIGPGSGIRGTFWVILLGTLQAGPLYGAFPVAYILWKKGCSVRNIFIYLGAFSTMKLPLFAFEIGFLGLKFSVLRTLITMPVFIVIGIIMDLILRGTTFSIFQVNKEE
jgi:uncharacterized membrane protein YraQ (UPF0718 family)